MQCDNIAQASQTSIILEKQKKNCDFVLSIFAKYEK